MVEHHWRTWVAENLVRGCSDDLLRQKLVGAGIAVDEADATIAQLKDPAWLAVAKKLETRGNKRDWLLRTLLDLQRNHGPGLEVERRTGVSFDEFHTRYLAQNRPVVLLDVARDWPAMGKWTPAYLQRTLGDGIVEVQSGRDREANYERLSTQLKTRLPFSEFLKIVQSGEGNDHYLTANNGSANAAFLAPLAVDVGPLPSFLDGGSPGRAGLFWLGPAGTITPNHHDLTNNLLVQVMGRKRVLLSPSIAVPDMQNDHHVYSTLDPTKPETFQDQPRTPPWVEVLLLPGDALFIPIGWWHHVYALDASISLTFTNFVAGNDFADSFRAASGT